MNRDNIEYWLVKTISKSIYGHSYDTYT